MPDIRPISFSAFGDKAWKPFDNFSFASSTQVVTIAITELSRAVGSLPLAILPGERPSLVALLGLRNRTNLFVGHTDGKWHGSYIPAVLRGYPFQLLNSETGETLLGYDIASGLLAPAGEAEPFFTSNQEPTERIQKTLQFLLGIQQGNELSSRAIEKLSAYDVLEPWPIQVGEGENLLQINGLKRVSEQRLNTVSSEALMDLRNTGALTVAYAQLFSTINIRILIELAEVREREIEARSRQHKGIPGDFSLEPESDIQLDWDAILK